MFCHISGHTASDDVTQTLLPSLFPFFSPPRPLHSQTCNSQVNNRIAKFSRKESFPSPSLNQSLGCVSLLAPVSSNTHPGTQSHLWGEYSTLIGGPDPMPIWAEDGVNTTQLCGLSTGEVILGRETGIWCQVKGWEGWMDRCETNQSTNMDHRIL